jgi:hypothetical protein
LLSIDSCKSRFSGHAVVAHIRSLQMPANFAMPCVGRLTISSQLPGPEFPLSAPSRPLRHCTASGAELARTFKSVTDD